MELDKLEEEVLNLVLFPEEFAAIVDECKLTSDANVIGDVIKGLIHKSLVVPGLLDDDGNFRPGGMYNTDRMTDYMYVATSKGQERMQDHS